MNTQKKIFASRWVVALLVAIMAAAPLLLAGCGGCQKEEPAPPPPAAKTPPPAKPPVKTVEQAPLGSVVPVTLDLLKLAPSASMVTVALPPISGLYEKGIALAKRLAPEEMDIDAVMAMQVANMATDAGASGAASVVDIARAKGIDPDAPMALFIDLTPIAKSVEKGMAAIEAERKNSAAATPAESASAEPAPEAPAPTTTEEEINQLGDLLVLPGMVLVMGCSDPALAETTLKESLATSNDLDDSKLQDIEAGGVVIHSYGADVFSYAIKDKRLLASNSQPMLEETLTRLTAPAAVVYGTAAMPASEPDEVVIMTWMNKLQPLVQNLLPAVMALDPNVAKYAGLNMDMVNELFAALEGDDPVVSTLSWSNEKIELMSRTDVTKHPKMMEFVGEPKALRLAPLLPANTLLALSIGLNEKTKKSILDYLTKMPPEMAGGFLAATEEIGKVLELLGDEITLGLTDMSVGMPQLFLMAALANPEEGKAYLANLVPLGPADEKHGDVDLFPLAVPGLPISIYMAMPDDVVLLSNDLVKIKEIIDLLANKKQSDLFAKLDPPLDPATPRYGALLINTRLLSEVLLPLAGIAGGNIPPEVTTIMGKVSEVIREIRVTNEIKNNMLEKGMSIYLKPAA